MSTVPDLSRALFAGLVGDRFTVSIRVDGLGDTLTLASVEPLPHGPPGRDAFSLLFHGSPGLALPHDSLVVRHPAIGEATIFMGPVARDAEKTSYEAIFT